MNTAASRHVIDPTPRDPAWAGRVFWCGAALVLLWPLAVATEFRPWVLFEPANMRISAQFIGSFFPPALGGEFLALVAREAWRTVAIATVGMTLALVVAVPLTLLSTSALSVSALSGRMARGPFWLRQAVRWLLIVLRSVPELVWALVFVRVVGLGPTAGVLAIMLTYGGMLGKEFPDLFARYAERVAVALGDVVDYWITFNEPSQLTFGYIKPWWQNRYYMPPGLPRGSDVDAEAEAVGKLIPGLFRAHARARLAIRTQRAGAQVGVNPLVTGFPTWLQMLMDFGACHRGLAEALFKFTTRGALVSERGDVDLVIGGGTAGDQTRFEMSDPYLRTGKAVLVAQIYQGEGLASLVGRKVGVVAVGNQPASWDRDLPPGCGKKVFPNYDAARSALRAGSVDAVYGDAYFLLPQGAHGLRFLTTGLSDEAYVVVAPHGHEALLARVNRAVAAFQQEAPGILPAGSVQ
mgnify:CR=1 FL=1